MVMGKAIRTVGVLGAGLMGHGIAQLAAQADCETVLVDTVKESLEKARLGITQLLEKRVQSGKLSEESAKGIVGRIKFSQNMLDLAECDLIIEAVPEIMSLKKEVFAQLDQIAKSSALLATNTSQLSITEIAAVTGRSDQVIGMHFFYPAQVMKLVEIPVGEHTSVETVAAIVELAQSMGKETVVCKDTPGFIVNRLLAGLMVEATRVYDEKLASIEDVDKALKYALGHPMGPFELFDFSGIDTMVRVADGLRDAFGERFRVGTGVRNKVRAGDYGRKSGRGFYRYKKDDE